MTKSYQIARLSIHMTKVSQNIEAQEAFKRFSSEIRNKTFALAYLAVKDCVNQKEYCKRININESRFSRVLSKVEKELTDTSSASI